MRVNVVWRFKQEFGAVHRHDKKYCPWSATGRTTRYLLGAADKITVSLMEKRLISCTHLFNNDDVHQATALGFRTNSTAEHKISFFYGK